MENPETPPNHPNRYIFKAFPLKELTIPVFSGSMIRGAIGHALLEHCCHCGTNHHKAGCLYAELFETPAGNTFVITPPKPEVIAPGTPFTFRLTLLRPTPEREQVILDAVERALAQGLTQLRTPCQLMSVVSQEPSQQKLGKIALLHLLSPWFIKRNGQRVAAEQCTVHTLLIAMAQRQRALSEQGLLDTKLPTNGELLRFADGLNGQLRLQDLRGERHSNRQRARHPLFGFMGTVTFVAPKGQTLAPVESMLRTAEWVHGGGKVSFGLGGLAVQGQTELSSLNL